MKIGKKFIFHGKVQGVFFRQSTKNIADKMQISGLIKNKDDGTVSMNLYSEKINIEKFLTLLKNQKYAQGITRIDCFDSKEKHNNFTILR